MKKPRPDPGFLMRMAPTPELGRQLHALGLAIREACKESLIPAAEIALMLAVLGLDFARTGGAEAATEEEPDDERPH